MNFEESSSIGGALLTPGDHLLNLRLLLFCEFRPSTADPSFLPGGIQPGFGSLSKHGPLEFRVLRCTTKGRI